MVLWGGGTAVTAAWWESGLSVTVVTNTGEARNAILVWSADATIVVGGPGPGALVRGYQTDTSSSMAPAKPNLSLRRQANVAVTG